MPEMTDEQRSAVLAALQSAGVDPAAAPDALRLFVPTRAPDGSWSHDGMSQSSLDRLAGRFLEKRSYLTGQADEPEPEQDTRPRYADGSLVPAAKQSDAELERALLDADARLREVSKPHAEPPRPTLTAAQLDALDDDGLAEVAGAWPGAKPVDGGWS